MSGLTARPVAAVTGAVASSLGSGAAVGLGDAAVCRANFSPGGYAFKVRREKTARKLSWDLPFLQLTVQALCLILETVSQTTSSIVQLSPPVGLSDVDESGGLRALTRVSNQTKRENVFWGSEVTQQFGHPDCGSCGIKKSFLRCQSLAEDNQNISDEEIFAVQARELLGADEPQNFFDRLARAWSILFPNKRRSTSNAEIAKQRLKMILISDRCSVNDEAKRRIVNNIVGALSDFVEIEAEDKVQLSVSSDPDLGTVYSVSVPVRRVKPEYQEYSRDLQNVAISEEFRSLDLKLEYQSDSTEDE
ncbi:hypothetical protein R1sor_012988 [Riccia sorocarpa]|uniref:Cell division topological specificity factor n=1 Tax=Riccia sorocarpa TaxID=122646 RepID=A0ABD3I5A1_9MARC